MIMNISRQYENIIFDAIIITCPVISFFVSIVTLVLIFFSPKTRKKDRINNLLTANSFLALVIVSLFTIDMYGYTMYGHLHPNNCFDGWWCKIKSFFLYSSGASFMYSLFLHAFYRFCRIIYPTRRKLQSFRTYQFVTIIEWIYCLLSILILLLTGDIRYVQDDFNCQVEIINMRGMLILAPIAYFIPSCSTTICYNYTLYYYRKHITIRIDTRQQSRNRRDMVVLKHIFMILTFVIIVGLPTIIICIIYYICHQLPWWSRQFGWLTLALSYGSSSLILILTSRQLRKLWIQPWNRVHP